MAREGMRRTPALVVPLCTVSTPCSSGVMIHANGTVPITLCFAFNCSTCALLRGAQTHKLTVLAAVSHKWKEARMTMMPSGLITSFSVTPSLPNVLLIKNHKQEAAAVAICSRPKQTLPTIPATEFKKVSDESSLLREETGTAVR